MEINFNTVLTDLRGENPLRETEDKESPVSKLGTIAINALHIPQPGIPMAEKMKRIVLAAEIEMAMSGDGMAGVESEDIGTLKALIDAGWSSPLICAQCHLLLEGKSWPIVKKAEAAQQNGEHVRKRHTRLPA